MAGGNKRMNCGAFGGRSRAIGAFGMGLLMGASPMVNPGIWPAATPTAARRLVGRGLFRHKGNALDGRAGGRVRLLQGRCLSRVLYPPRAPSPRDGTNRRSSVWIPTLTSPENPAAQPRPTGN